MFSSKSVPCFFFQKFQKSYKRSSKNAKKNSLWNPFQDSLKFALDILYIYPKILLYILLQFLDYRNFTKALLSSIFQRGSYWSHSAEISSEDHLPEILCEDPMELSTRVPSNFFLDNFRELLITIFRIFLPKYSKKLFCFLVFNFEPLKCSCKVYFSV